MVYLIVSGRHLEQRKDDRMDNTIDSDAIGVELSWSFGYGDAAAVTLPRTQVVNAVHAAGFPGYVPECIDADDALRRAAKAVKGRSKTIVIQELRRPNRDTLRAYGVYRVTGQDGEAGDSIDCKARVRIEDNKVVCLPPEGDLAFADMDCENIGRGMSRLANTLIRSVINRDISDMLVAIGWSQLGWISRRRNSGGVYFALTSDATERFVTLLQALECLTVSEHIDRANHFIPQIMEVYPKPLTMNMWSGSTKDQYQAQTESLLKELTKMRADDKMRDKTIKGHAEECDRLIALAESHRIFLADTVADITFELGKVKAGFIKKLDENAAAARADFDVIDQAVPPTPRRKRKVKATSHTVCDSISVDQMSNDELFSID